MARGVWVSLPYATFGIEVDEKAQKVVDAAPIGRWMIGKTFPFVSSWIARKGGTWEWLNSPTS